MKQTFTLILGYVNRLSNNRALLSSVIPIKIGDFSESTIIHIDFPNSHFTLFYQNVTVEARTFAPGMRNWNRHRYNTRQVYEQQLWWSND